MSEKKEDNDLLNYYPDLSDEEENAQEEEPQEKQEEELPGSQPYKLIKTNQDQPNKSIPIIAAPRMFGGRAFIPPPPPPGAKKFNPAQIPPEPQKPPSSSRYDQSKIHPQEHLQVRHQRKNCLYVRNIPKHYNDKQKLMTFFKNEGQIKQINVKPDQNSAIVRFMKEQNALRFVNSKKAIFNRSFITYSLNDKETVAPQLVKQRENQEAGKIKKPVEIEMRQLKERIDNILADKIRALLFVVKNIVSQQARPQYEKELNSCIEYKNNVAKLSYEEITEAVKLIENEYDWTIGYALKSQVQIDPKIYSALISKKYGPVTSLEITSITQPNTDPLPEQTQPQHYQYIVKATFLSPKQTWQFYYEKQILSKMENKETEEKEVEIEGASLKSLFNEGIIKPPLVPQEQTLIESKQSPKEEQQGLVEINEQGEVRLLEPEAPLLPQPQVANQDQVPTNKSQPE